MSDTSRGNHIGMVKESSLHAALKDWYKQPDDRIEEKVLGFFIDIVRGSQLIEIQTANFSAISRKINTLLETYPVHLVYPLPVRKWIKKYSPDNEISIRKSPKNGRLEDIFWEVVRIPKLINHPNFTLEVLRIHVEEIWISQQATTRRTSWRRKGWAIYDRQLIQVVDSTYFGQPADYGRFLDNMPEGIAFTSGDIAQMLKIRLLLAQKMVYTFRNIGIIQVAGKKQNAVLYKRTALGNNK